jgi:hypothetical protein
MGSKYGDQQMYCVKAFDTRGGERHLRPMAFEGERAFSDAGELLDRLKADPDVMEVAMTRRDGGDWKFVERCRRNERGEWVAIPFSQDYPTPDDEDDD